MAREVTIPDLTPPGPVYIAGPMSNLPSFNFPAFDAAAADLRAQGFTVFSPAELDNPRVRKAALENRIGDLRTFRAKTGETWSSLLSRDVIIIAQHHCHVVALPNWVFSKGASFEVFVAVTLGQHAYQYPSLTPIFPEFTLTAGKPFIEPPADLASLPQKVEA